MLGSRFPSTGQGKKARLPMGELIFQPTPVADGESKNKECNQKVISWAFYKTFE